jgi:hypothetical protein
MPNTMARMDLCSVLTAAKVKLMIVVALVVTLVVVEEETMKVKGEEGREKRAEGKAASHRGVA